MIGTAAVLEQRPEWTAEPLQIVGGDSMPPALSALGLQAIGSTATTLKPSAKVTTDDAEPSRDTVIAPIAPRPRPAQLDRCIVLQKWEGRVESIDGETFVATLTDTLGAGPTELAEFSIDELSPFDVPLLAPGAIFYWNIGYRLARSGQRTRESVIRFRRMPRWSKSDRIEAAARAERWRHELGWND